MKPRGKLSSFRDANSLFEGRQIKRQTEKRDIERRHREEKRREDTHTEKRDSEETPKKAARQKRDS
jgi:hypothetical protein